MFSTICFLLAASRVLTLSRSAVLSSPSTMRPSSATTATPSTSRLVIFSATFKPPPSDIPESGLPLLPGPAGALPGYRPVPVKARRLVKVRAGHEITAHRAKQLTAPRLKLPRASRAVARHVHHSRLQSTKIRRFPEHEAIGS